VEPVPIVVRRTVLTIFRYLICARGGDEGLSESAMPTTTATPYATTSHAPSNSAGETIRSVDWFENETQHAFVRPGYVAGNRAAATTTAIVYAPVATPKKQSAQKSLTNMSGD
jgi:hypothetical protein